MTDIERIRRDLVACRDIPWSCSCVEPEQLAALVEEVERLRAKAADLQMQLDERLLDNQHAYDEGYDAGTRRGYEGERSAVVAWLRAQVSQAVSAGDLDLDWAADTIERGEHRREEKT